jgi:hypothetical protein
MAAADYLRAAQAKRVTPQREAPGSQPVAVASSARGPLSAARPSQPTAVTGRAAPQAAERSSDPVAPQRGLSQPPARVHEDPAFDSNGAAPVASPQRQPSERGSRLAQLQSEAADWRRQRDAAQIVFMQETSALERSQRSIELTRARVERKRQLMILHAAGAADATQPQSGGPDSSTATTATTVQHARVARRDAAVQCDAALAAAADFATALEVSHRDNVGALARAHNAIAQGEARRCERLARDVADMVQRVRVMEREVQLQAERFRLERMAPAQIAAAEALARSVVLGRDGLQRLIDRAAASASIDGPALDADEAYRVVERARLALSQSLTQLESF